MTGVELSFLSPQEQGYIQKLFQEDSRFTITRIQAQRIRQCSQAGELSVEKVREILSIGRIKREKFVIKPDKLSEYFDRDIPNEEIEEIIFQLLDDWKKTVISSIELLDTMSRSRETSS